MQTLSTPKRHFDPDVPWEELSHAVEPEHPNSLAAYLIRVHMLGGDLIGAYFDTPLKDLSINAPSPVSDRERYDADLSWVRSYQGLVALHEALEKHGKRMKGIEYYTKRIGWAYDTATNRRKLTYTGEHYTARTTLLNEVLSDEYRHANLIEKDKVRDPQYRNRRIDNIVSGIAYKDVDGFSHPILVVQAASGPDKENMLHRAHMRECDRKEFLPVLWGSIYPHPKI